MDTILNKSSTHAEFAELFVRRIPNVYVRVDIMADCYKMKSIKSPEQLSIKRGQSEKIHRASLLTKVSSDFYNSILRTDAIWNGKGKAACFKILQGSSKFQSTFATLGNDLNIFDDLLTKLE